MLSLQASGVKRAFSLRSLTRYFSLRALRSGFASFAVRGFEFAAMLHKTSACRVSRLGV
jgi:hypothetical protein